MFKISRILHIFLPQFYWITPLWMIYTIWSRASRHLITNFLWTGQHYNIWRSVVAVSVFSSSLIWQILHRQSCCWGCKNWSKMLFKSHRNLLGCLVRVLSPVTSLKSTVMRWMTPSQEHRTDKLYKAKIKSRVTKTLWFRVVARPKVRP